MRDSDMDNPGGEKAQLACGFGMCGYGGCAALEAKVASINLRRGDLLLTSRESLKIWAVAAM